MKKFTTIAMTLLLGGVAAYAELGTPTLTSPTGDYITNPNEIIVQWMNDKTASTIELVDPKTNEDGDSCVDITITLPDGTAETAEATLYQGSNGGNVSGSENSGIGLIVRIEWGSEPYYKDWALQTGEWKVEVPADVVKDEEGNQNTVFETEFTVWRQVGWDPMTNPEIGTSADKAYISTYAPSALASLEFIWYDAEDPALEILTDATVTLQTVGSDGWCTDSTAEDAVQDIKATVNDDKNGLVFDLSDLAEGFYKISFPEKCLILDANTIWSGGMEYYVEIFDGMAAGEVVYPETNLASIFSIINFSWAGQEITFADADSTTVSVSVPGETDPIEVPATLVYIVSDANVPSTPDFGPDDSPVEDNVAALADDDEVYNGISIDVLDLVLQYGSGTYTVTVPKGLVKNSEDMINPSQTYDFRVYPIAQVEATITASETELVVSYPTFYTFDNSNVGQAEIRDADGETVSQVYIMPMFGASVYTADLEDGEYALVIPEGYFLLYTENYEETFLSGETYFTFKVENGTTTGVKGIEASQLNVISGVYNLQGVKVADSNNLNGLSNGIYIIDGKKVIIRK